MRKIESLFICASLAVTIIGVGAAIWHHGINRNIHVEHDFTSTNFGSFLAAQHALYVNDFDMAHQLANSVTGDVDYPIVQSMRYLTGFLSGKMPTDPKLLKDEKNPAAGMIYDTYLVTESKWDELYKRHKGDESAISAPLRIWSSVATGRVKDALKFIEKLPTNASWKSFIRGQIYATTGDVDRAATEFANVNADFLNINDYLYLMSFYSVNQMFADVDILRAEFTARPGGMYMLQYDDFPDWTAFSGYKNALAFSLVQTVSHTQVMMYSDLAIIFLRMAQICGTDFAIKNPDAINYYLGQYFFDNRGDFEPFFAQIKSTSPFYLFTVMRRSQRTGDIDDLARGMRENPLFVTGANRLIAYNIANGNRRAALRVVNRALDNENLNELGRAFFMKSRAHIHYMFGDLDAAADDLHDASVMLPGDKEILALQAKIWARQGREIENAYEYAMGLVKMNPADIFAWDTLGRVVYVREGHAAAFEVIERVGEISVSCSGLFEQLGDLYAEQGDIDNARDAYLRAIDLSDDGLVIVPDIRKKIRKLK